jgi:DNA-directed RNA polymerase specialized sigma24 family protein
LGAALTAFPPEQRSAIELAFFGGRTHDQITTLNGVLLDTVTGRVRLGLHPLRRNLQDLTPSSPETQPGHMRAARMIQDSP